jgi:hypothetical protein
MLNLLNLTLKLMTEPLFPAAQAVLDAADAVLEQANVPTWLIARGIAAALLALALLLALGAAVELSVKVIFVKLLPLLLRLH